MKQFYKINEISKLYNIGPDSLRYYEKLGLLAPKRGKNNYRLYTLDDLWRLNIIRDLRRLGFPMEKIREYMDNRSVENTRKLLTEELDAIHQQIQELNRLQKTLKNVCRHYPVPKTRHYLKSGCRRSLTAIAIH